eukprot:2587474-Pyramimonas_sp.AAC.1
MRAARSKAPGVLRRAVKAYPKLEQLFDVELCAHSNLVGFHSCLANLKRQQIDDHIDEIQHD